MQSFVRGRPWARLALVMSALALAPGAASAYVGPGAGLTAIGTVLALFAAVALAIVGFVWYPLKRLFKRARPASGTPDDRRPQ
jgi:hypothetical protein